MKCTAKQIGKLVRDTRKAMGVTQQDLALTSGTGQRFISDLENGKATCHLGKVLTVIQTLGIQLQLFCPIDINATSSTRAKKNEDSNKG